MKFLVFFLIVFLIFFIVECVDIIIIFVLGEILFICEMIFLLLLLGSLIFKKIILNFFFLYVFKYCVVVDVFWILLIFRCISVWFKKLCMVLILFMIRIESCVFILFF